MGAFVAAWLTGEGIIAYRSVKKNHAPPWPGEMLIASGIFVLLGLLAESQRARPIAVTLAWGFDIAALMNLFPTNPNPLANVNVIPWPPPTAQNTQVIPDGKWSATSGSSSSSSNSNTTTPPPSSGTIAA